MHSRKQVLSTYLHVLLLFHSQKYAILFHNDSDHHFYPKESLDYNHDIKHYPDRTNPIYLSESADSPLSYHPDADEVRCFNVYINND